MLGYAGGYATMELSCPSGARALADGRSDLEAGVELARMLPPAAPAELAQVARDCCGYDPDAQFEFGLEALLAELDPECETRDESALPA